MVFPVVMYGCGNWTIKKAECWRTDAFELWCWRSLLRVPWTARRSNQSILKEISSEYSLEGLMLKLKLMKDWPSKRPWCWARLKAGEKGEDREWDGWMVGWHHSLNAHEFEQALGDGEGSFFFFLFFKIVGTSKDYWSLMKTRTSQMVLVVRNLPINARNIKDTESNPGLGRSPGGEHSNPLQNSCLGSPMNTGDRQAAVRSVAKSRTWWSTCAI